MSTNYYNTLITIANDSPTLTSTEPNMEKSTVASQQFRWISEQPYHFTSDDVIYRRVAEKEGVADHLREAGQREYFRTGRACLRASPLPKQYGWGIHSNAEGKIALVAAESEEYGNLMADESVKKLAAMKKSRT